MGHTAVIHAKDDARIREFAVRMPAMRVLVNTPAPQGSTGITTNVFPSMTLGCGAVAGNITSDNVGPQHLINIKRLAYVVRKPEEASRCRSITCRASASPPAHAVTGKVAAAVERYLASRGMRYLAGRPALAAPGAAYLAALGVLRQAPARRGRPAKPGGRQPRAPLAAPTPSPWILCAKADVRAAIEEKRKINRTEDHRDAFRPRSGWPIRRSGAGPGMRINRGSESRNAETRNPGIPGRHRISPCSIAARAA